MASFEDLRAWLGQVDIQLLDQVLKGRIEAGMRVADAGCGSGRNLLFLLDRGVDAVGIDQEPSALSSAADTLVQSGRDPARHLVFGDLRHPDPAWGVFDAVISNAVLHFASDEEEFLAMLRGKWTLLRPGGLFFARLTSSIGLRDPGPSVRPRVHDLPDGSRRFLVDLDYLLRLGDELEGVLVDPIKTVNVQEMRCMTTWVLRRRD